MSTEEAESDRNLRELMEDLRGTPLESVVQETIDKDLQQLKKDAGALNAVDPEKEDAELTEKLERAVKIAEKVVYKMSMGTDLDNKTAILATAVFAKMK